MENWFLSRLAEEERLRPPREEEPRGFCALCGRAVWRAELDGRAEIRNGVLLCADCAGKIEEERKRDE